ncbi:MAG: tetratricopeptide repeat protein [Thermotogae bacterium]|nr:tetratricopeptide repeat protein [Thermotogota bacterium]
MILWLLFQSDTLQSAEGNQPRETVQEEEVIVGEAELQITDFKRPLYFYLPDMVSLVPEWKDVFSLSFEDSLSFFERYTLPPKPQKKGWFSKGPQREKLVEWYLQAAKYGVGLVRVGLFEDALEILKEVAQSDYLTGGPSYVVRTYLILAYLYSGDPESGRTFGSIFLSDYYNRPWNEGIGWVVWATGESNFYAKHWLQAESIYARNINEGKLPKLVALSRMGAAWCNLHAGKYPEAYSHASQSEGHLSGVPKAHALLAKAISAFNMGRTEEALNVLLSIGKTGHPPTDAEILYYLGFIYEAMRDYQKALSYYQKVMEDYANLPRAGDAAYRTYTIYLGNGNQEAAKKTLIWFVERFPNHPDAPRALYTLAEIFYNEKDYRSSLKYLKQLYTNYPESDLYSVARQRAQQVYGILSRQDTTILWEFLREFPNSNDVAEAFLYWGGKFLEEGKDTVAARYLYRMGVEFPKHPQAPDALLSAGKIYFNLKMWSDAAQTFRKVVRLYPNFKNVREAKILLAVSLINLKKDIEAIRILEKELQKPDLTDAERADIYKYLGIAYKALGKSYKARNYLEEAKVLYFALGKLDEVDKVDKLMEDIPY